MLCDHLESTRRASIEIKVDYYWVIDQEDKYMLDSEPGSLGMGQISDDWQEVQDLISGKTEPSTHVLIHLAAIMCLIGETTQW